MAEMHAFNNKLYKFVEEELPNISDPHIIGGVMAASLQSFWVGIMGAEATAKAFRDIADHVEEDGDEDEPVTIH